jgi:DNA-binding PadR family transcriptional regulator
MAQQNRTRFAVLGMLAFRPMSGYDIKKMIDKSVSYFWKENYGHIYPVLAKLKSEGLVRLQGKSAKSAKGGPERKVYSITPEGSKVIKDWLYQPHAPEYFRIEILLKLFFGMLVPREVSLSAVYREKSMALQVLNELKELCEQGSKMPAREASLFPLATINYGIKHYTAVMEWCDETVALLQNSGKKEAKK